MITENSWVEIDLSRIVNNYRTAASLVCPGKKVMAVVKANAYGHGDAEVAKALEATGCESFAVANFAEGKRLRESGVRGDILILGFSPREIIPEVIKYRLIQTLISEEHARDVARPDLRAVFAIDTGMNRIGIDAENAGDCERIIREYAKKTKLEGIFTHLCVADVPDEDAFTARQSELFYRIADRVSDLDLPRVHCLNSAGIIRFPDKDRGNTVRLGIALYGLSPDPAVALPDGILPALEWKTHVSMVKTVMPGETVGYGRAYTAEEPRRIATLTAGYADGYSRRMSRGGYVVINGKRAPLCGRVCMDQMTVDVTGIDGVCPMTEATLIGEGITADDMAAVTGTICYEALCAIGVRVRRIYKKRGKSDNDY